MNLPRRALILGPQVNSLRDLKCALALTGVEVSPRSDDLRVAVDGGLNIWKRLRIKPHFAVGDWDSLGSKESSRAALRGLIHFTLPRDKSRSDLYYACRAALAVKATDLICTGVTGGRPDHQLAMLFDLAEVQASAPAGTRIRVVDRHTQYEFLSGGESWTNVLKPGQTVSLFSLGGVAHGVTLDGFRYPLKNATLSATSLGLSNRVVKKQVRIQIKRGRVVVMILN